jgi:two-component system LytT family response regulator
MRVRTLVVDDEPVARAGLRAMLLAFEWVEVIGEAGDGESAVAAIESLQPELVFLDVQMPGLLGTEVLARIERQPLIIFTTAYAEHAVTAFELGAVDYLLKPFGPAASPRRWSGFAGRSASQRASARSNGSPAR